MIPLNILFIILIFNSLHVNDQSSENKITFLYLTPKFTQH